MQEMEKKFANSEEGYKRRIEDAESSLKVFKYMNVDLSRIKEHDELESKKGTRNTSKSQIKTMGLSKRSFVKSTRSDENRWDFIG